MKHKNTKAHDIPDKVKRKVYERDGERCILCHGANGYPGIPNAHYIGRAQEGLGIEENVVTLCPVCHDLYDFRDDTDQTKNAIKRYLDRFYPTFDDRDRIYDKWRYMRP